MPVSRCKPRGEAAEQRVVARMAVSPQRARAREASPPACRRRRSASNRSRRDRNFPVAARSWRRRRRHRPCGCRHAIDAGRQIGGQEQADERHAAARLSRSPRARSARANTASTTAEWPAASDAPRLGGERGIDLVGHVSAYRPRSAASRSRRRRTAPCARRRCAADRAGRRIDMRRERAREQRLAGARQAADRDQQRRRRRDQLCVPARNSCARIRDRFRRVGGSAARRSPWRGSRRAPTETAAARRARRDRSRAASRRDSG